MIGRKDCILKSLANPMLNGILLGLEWQDYQLVPQSSLLPCCEGRGYTEDPLKTSQIRCQLQRRIKLTEKILLQYVTTWSHCQDQLPHKLHPSHSAKILRQTSDTLKGYRPQGGVCNGRKGKPSDLWAMALACTWRFGIHSHMVHLDRVDARNLLPPPEKQQDALAIFIEQVDKVWDDRQASALEVLVNYAYNSNAFIWIEFCKDEGHKVDDDDLTLKANFSRRLSKLKQRAPHEFLAQDCVSQLKSLCSVPRTLDMEGFEND